MSNLNRRRFIKTGIAGAAGAAVVSPRAASLLEVGEERNVIIRTLGRTGLKIPVVSFGVMRSDNPGLCKAALAGGIKMFDTANGYQNGNNETMLGDLFRDVPRSSFIIQTKVKPSGIGRDGRPGDQTTAEDFLEKFTASLNRLKLEYVDILFIHDISNPEMLEFKPVVSAIEKLRKQKKARFIGFSTHNNMAGVIEAAAGQNIWDVILTSYNFRLNNLAEMNSAVSRAASAGIGIVAMKTLAGGFSDREKTKPVNSSAAIKWVLQNKDICTTIPGMTTFEHLEANLKVLEDINMTEEEKRDLTSAIAENGIFCSGCNSCLSGCRLNLPVPGIMRAYMYAYGYSDIPRAYGVLGELGAGSSPCVNCSDCTVKCPSGFSVREKISDVSRLVNVPSDFIV